MAIDVSKHERSTAQRFRSSLNPKHSDRLTPASAAAVELHNGDNLILVGSAGVARLGAAGLLGHDDLIHPEHRHNRIHRKFHGPPVRNAQPSSLSH